MIEFIINEPTLSLNELQREYRNVHARRREQERWDWLVFEAAGKLQAPDPCVAIITRCNNRLLDWDNMGGGLKFLFDAMKHVDVIVDDDPGHVQGLLMQQLQVPKKEAKTIIQLAEPGEPPYTFL